LSAAAHKIKGSSSSMRLSLMAKIAEKIEIESNDGWNDHLISQVSALKAEWEIVKKIIQQKLN
jgi:HPt (histidine-containing phosphotransfer) domain-containing protein